MRPPFIPGQVGTTEGRGLLEGDYWRGTAGRGSTGRRGDGLQECGGVHKGRGLLSGGKLRKGECTKEGYTEGKGEV